MCYDAIIIQDRYTDITIRDTGPIIMLRQPNGYDPENSRVFIEKERLTSVVVELLRHAITAGSLSDDQRAALLALLMAMPALPTVDAIRCESLRRLAQAEQDNCND